MSFTYGGNAGISVVLDDKKQTVKLIHYSVTSLHGERNVEVEVPVEEFIKKFDTLIGVLSGTRETVVQND